MKYHYFQYGIPFPGEMTDLNDFLGSHRVTSVRQYLAASDGQSYLVFVVEYAEGEKRSGPETRVDYREELNDEEFLVFSRLRDERRAIADAEGVPVYNVFTNAQLAALVKRKAVDAAGLRAVPGLGQARVEKYGERILTICRSFFPGGKDGHGGVGAG